MKDFLNKISINNKVINRLTIIYLILLTIKIIHYRFEGPLFLGGWFGLVSIIARINKKRMVKIGYIRIKRYPERYTEEQNIVYSLPVEQVIVINFIVLILIGSIALIFA